MTSHCHTISSHHLIPSHSFIHKGNEVDVFKKNSTTGATSAHKAQESQSQTALTTSLGPKHLPSVQQRPYMRPTEQKICTLGQKFCCILHYQELRGRKMHDHSFSDHTQRSRFGLCCRHNTGIVPGELSRGPSSASGQRWPPRTLLRSNSPPSGQWQEKVQRSLLQTLWSLRHESRASNQKIVANDR
jgi:hypothetical protein